MNLNEISLYILPALRDSLISKGNKPRTSQILYFRYRINNANVGVITRGSIYLRKLMIDNRHNEQDKS
jgi:hypothetical protein